MSPTILHIAKLELTHAFRSRGFRWFSGALLAIFAVASAVSFQSDRRATAEAHALQHVVQEQWETQPDRHPHRVAHYGYLAFRPRTALSFFDLGVSEFTGNSIFLEAHVQNSANFSEAKQESSLLRFGRLTPAFLLQVVVPLLIIFQCGRNVTRERENSTLAQVLSLGVNWRDFLGGKVLGGVALFGLLLIPPVAGVTLLGLPTMSTLNSDLLVRFLLLIFVYFWYLCSWVVLATAVSARSSTSSMATVVLLGCWIVLTTLLPKALPSLGSYLYAAPSRPELEHSIHLEAVKGGHGHDPDAVQFDSLKRELFEKHGVAKVEDLPVNWRGIAMREGERATAQVYHRHYSELSSTFARQNSLSKAGALIDPYLLVRHLSAALCGTDLAAAADFEEQAEAYRYNLIQKLNELHIDEIGYQDDKQQRLSSVHWDDFEPFRLTPSSIESDVSRNRLLFLALMLQGLFLLAFLFFSPGRER
jgi:ABC-2 type transport system permease protein